MPPSDRIPTHGDGKNKSVTMVHPKVSDPPQATVGDWQEEEFAGLGWVRADSDDGVKILTARAKKADAEAKAKAEAEAKAKADAAKGTGTQA